MDKNRFLPDRSRICKVFEAEGLILEKVERLSWCCTITPFRASGHAVHRLGNTDAGGDL